LSSETSTIATIKIKFPDDIWISAVFRKFYDINMEILYFLPYDLEESIGNAIIELMHYDIDSVIKEIENHPSVYEFHIVDKEENKIKFNVKTKDPYLLYAVIKCGVLVDFPVKIEDGYAYWDLISTRKSIDQLLSLFDEEGVKYELLRIGNSDLNLEDGKYKLSLDEIKLLETAIRRGFFDVPRKISLEELGSILNKSKSTLSVQLRKIIKKKVLANP
jgi:predicted DNA binding protein